MTVTGADERIHPVEDTSEHWSDSLYFNLWDEASGLFLLTRMASLPNQPGAGFHVVQHGGTGSVSGYVHDGGEDHRGPRPTSRPELLENTSATVAGR